MADVHCLTGAPREAVVKITKAEAGRIDGKAVASGRARLPAQLESPAIKSYLAGGFVNS